MNYFDYGARMYDSRIGRWHSVDRFSEEYYPYSPYNYAIGNPLLFIDVNGDYISFYELAQYQNNLPNYSYSVNATDIDAGDWSISRYYNDDGDIVGYGAWRDGQFYVMDEEGDLDIFLNKLSTFSNAADLFYMNGSPSEGMLAMLSGDYFKGLGLLWGDAISDPNYFISTALLLANAGIGGIDVANVRAATLRSPLKVGPIKGYTNHGLMQAIGRDGGRGVSIATIKDAAINPTKIIHQNGGTIKYVGQRATVILNEQGKIVTTFGVPRNP